MQEDTSGYVAEFRREIEKDNTFFFNIVKEKKITENIIN